MAITFAKDALIQFGGTYVTDHNRDGFPVKNEIIKNDIRTANGSLRRDHIAVKKEWSLNWTDLPWLDSETVDGYMGAQSIINFIDSNTGSWTMTITEKDLTTTAYTVMFTDYDWELTKRWGTDFYDISVSIAEV